MNLEDIAQLAGVSKATVSSVLNGKADKYRISKATQAKVLDIVKQHDYQPNFSAASLRRGKSQSIGIIVPDFENRSYLRIAKRLEALARKNDYQLIIASSDDSPTTEANAAQMLIARGVDALLVSTSMQEYSLYEGFMARGTPVIALDRAMPDTFSNVISDDRQGAKLLTQALPLHQLASMTLIGALPNLVISQQREIGFKEAASAYRNLKTFQYYGEHFDSESGIQALKKAIEEQGQLPPAIVTTSYALLEGVIELLQGEYPEVLRQRPYQISLATFGNSRLLDFLPIPVASLPQQYEQIAEAAWMLAKQAIDKDYLAQKIVIRRVLKKRTRADLIAN